MILTFSVFYDGVGVFLISLGNRESLFGIHVVVFGNFAMIVFPLNVTFFILISLVLALLNIATHNPLKP